MPKPVKQEGEDPDPTPYLFVSLEQKRIDQSKPYDGKKACWVPDDKEGFLQGEIKATKGELVTVSLPGGEVSIPAGDYHNLHITIERRALCPSMMNHGRIMMKLHAVSNIVLWHRYPWSGILKSFIELYLYDKINQVLSGIETHRYGNILDDTYARTILFLMILWLQVIDTVRK